MLGKIYTEPLNDEVPDYVKNYNIKTNEFTDNRYYRKGEEKYEKRRSRIKSSIDKKIFQMFIHTNDMILGRGVKSALLKGKKRVVDYLLLLWYALQYTGIGSHT